MSVRDPMDIRSVTAGVPLKLLDLEMWLACETVSSFGFKVSRTKQIHDSIWEGKSTTHVSRVDN
jgi:hypothetical protein